MNTNINKIINDYIEYATQKNNIDAIVLSGSQTSLINDNMSDYDIYVYSKEKVNIEMREKFAKKYSINYELGNNYFEYGDEIILKENNICLDFMYRDISYIENEIDYVWRKCNSKIGYTTAFLYNIKNSRILYESNGYFRNFQKELNKDYPKQLKYNIIEKNYNVMYAKQSASFYEQLKNAIKRKDIVSINHRTSAILASYFDILFAINEELHVGEKKLIDYAKKLCSKLPNNFDKDIEDIINNNNILEKIENLIGNIKKLF